MTLTSIVPLISMMLLFALTGYVFSLLPPYRDVISRIVARKSYSSELEGMRGLLAFSVVIHHVAVWYLLLFHGTPEITGPNANLYSQLGVGSVTMFFFITGFLFWSKLIAQPEQNFKTFMSSRLRRLGPAYLAAAALMFALVALLSHFQLHTSPLALLQDMLRVLLAETPALNNLASAPWLWGVTWTLRFECLFYLIIPFLGWFAGSFRKSLLFLAACGVLYGLNRLARAEHFTPAGFILYEGFIRHLVFTFSFGIMSAQLVRVQKIKQFGKSAWAASIGVALIAINWYFVPAKYGLVESASLAFPFLAVACGCSYWGLLRSRAVLFMGQISYSVYLIHPLVFGAVLLPLYRMKSPALQTSREYWILFFLMAPAIVGVATLWHRMFELPFLMRSTRTVVPTVTDSLPLHPAYAVAGGAPVPQRQMHAFAYGSDPDRGGEVKAMTPGALSPLRRAGFLPRKSRRTPSTRS